MFIYEITNKGDSITPGVDIVKQAILFFIFVSILPLDIKSVDPRCFIVLWKMK